MTARLPLLVLAVIALLAGLATGLVRLGWGAGVPAPSPLLHGPLMVSGFFGTLISLERAVALRRRWAYGAPLLCGLGALTTLAGSPRAGALLLTAGSLALVALGAQALRIQRAPFVWVMAGGAAALLVGNGLWLAGRPVPHAVLWWTAFLVLTVAGERLELSRVLLHAPHVQRLFVALTALLGAGVVLSPWQMGTGWRAGGAALALLALWLGRYDVARRTARQTGITRFIAWCLLTGYAWLLVGGALMLYHGAAMAGPAYDATLHAVFLGFVFSMVFGHAPIIIPAVLGVPVAYRPLFYGHLLLLHASLLVRVAGDLTGELTGDPAAGLALRRWGGLINAATILVFFLSTAAMIAAERRRLRSVRAPSRWLSSTG